MNGFVKISDFNASEIDVYARLTGAQLKSRLDPEHAVFIAESPSVINTALDSGLVPVSFLTDERLLHGDVEMIIERIQGLARDAERNIPIYVGERDVLKGITGFELTRGALAAFKRPPLPSLTDVLSGARRVAVLEEIADSTNVGAIFRSAAALGFDAVLVTPTTCDPLSRRAIRVSMGTVFQVPWTRIGDTPREWPRIGISALHSLGFKCAAMALSDNSVPIDDEALGKEERIAVILGTEGTGLKSETIALSDYTVKIPMYHGVDSLNVGAAAAVAFWQLGAGRKN